MSTLPPAASLIDLDFEKVLLNLKKKLISLDSSIEKVINLESEPVTKLLQTFAYYITFDLQANINDGIKATMISTAANSDLDNLLSLFGTPRLTILAADMTKSPPILEIMESDEAYRKRGLLALGSWSNAGPKEKYIYEGLKIPGVHDIKASSPSNGVVDIKIISKTGTADSTLISLVTKGLNDEKVRPLGTQLTVSSATAVDYKIQAIITTDSTAKGVLAFKSAEAALNKYVESSIKIGKDIYLSNIYAALQKEGVENVDLSLPASNISISDSQFANNKGINLSVAK